MAEEIVNRVANSPLMSLDLEDYWDEHQRAVIDLKDVLHEGLILREKDFREYVKSHDWSAYRDKHVAIDCTAEALIPSWAYMIIVSRVEPYAQSIIVGSAEDLTLHLYIKAFDNMDFEQFRDGKVVIKGCSNKPVPPSVYAEVTRRLSPFVSSIMYGEPCSTVPVFKKPRS